MGLLVVPVGTVPPGLAALLAEFLGGAVGEDCRVRAEGLDPAPAHDAARGQANCRLLLPALEALVPAEGARALGIADVDLFSPIFTHVFGEASLGGKAGVFSLHRLRPTLYGLPEDPALLLARARREGLHETGHLLGLAHCREPACVMRFSGSVEEVDLKEDAFCAACLEAISSRRGSSRSPSPGSQDSPPPRSGSSAPASASS